MKKKELFKIIAAHVADMMKAVGFDRRHPMQSKLEELLLIKIQTVVLEKVGVDTAEQLADQVLVDARRDLRDRRKNKRNGPSQTDQEGNA